MESIDSLIKTYLRRGMLMQLATVRDGQPWICTVFYVVDRAQNLYWLSLPDRRHSQELSVRPQVAAAVVIKPDKPVIGVQVEGDAEEVLDPDVIVRIMKLYVDKYQSGKDFYTNFIAGKNKHQMYRIRPRRFVLFDQKNFPGDASHEWQPCANFQESTAN